jgi:hypothetical protein
MASIFNMDDILASLNYSEHGDLVDSSTMPNYSNFSFKDSTGSEYELATGISKNREVIKVRYGSSLTPLNQNSSGYYYLYIYDGKNQDGSLKPFRKVSGEISQISANFQKREKKSTKKSSTSKALGVSVKSKISKKEKPKQIIDMDMLSDEQLEEYDSPAARKIKAKRIRESRKQTIEELDPLADLMGGIVLFGKRRSSISLKYINSAIKYLKSI